MKYSIIEQVLPITLNMTEFRRWRKHLFPLKRFFMSPHSEMLLYISVAGIITWVIWPFLAEKKSEVKAVFSWAYCPSLSGGRGGLRFS